MSKSIRRVKHNHDCERNLVLEAGAQIPPYYRPGRSPNRIVTSITGSNPIVCTLDDGDQILIGPRSVVSIDFDDE